MQNLDRDNLMKDYVKNFKKYIYQSLKFTGFCRFDIINDEIVELTHITMAYNAFILIIANCCVGFLLYSSVVLGNYLEIPDGLCISHFALFANVILLNLTFLNRKSGLDIIENCLKVDSYLGFKETACIRDAAIKTYLAVYYMVIFTNICGGIFLYQVYKVSVSIHVVGSLYFFWLFFAYDDYVFALMCFIQNALRIRYLNVALQKIGEMNEEYLPKQSIFNIIYGRIKIDTVNFHNRAGIREFNKAFQMCFAVLEVLEKYYRFPILCGVWTVVMGTFVAVQTFIMRVKNSSALDNEHTFVIVAWVILSWGFMILVTLFTDMFQQQIQQTKLICCYTQLKPNKSAEIYKLTKAVLGTIAMRNAVPNIYHLFDFETGFVLKIAASTLVYITVQLQLAFPRLPLNSMKLNETNV